MSTIDDLIRQLGEASGETLHRTILELGNRGATARGAVIPLRDLVRYHEDQVARGHALLSIGLIDPHFVDHASCAEFLGDELHLARKGANSLDAESARAEVVRLLMTPLGSLDVDNKVDPAWSRVVWIEQIARRFPFVIPSIVEALTLKHALGEGLTMVPAAGTGCSSTTSSRA